MWSIFHFHPHFYYNWSSNLIKIDARVFNNVFYNSSYSFWMVTSMKKVNNFQGSRKTPPRKIPTHQTLPWKIPTHFINCLSALFLHLILRSQMEETGVGESVHLHPPILPKWTILICPERLNAPTWEKIAIISDG